jgi:hypothetical protein
VPTLSERFDWALRRAMCVDREQRPLTCREFVEDLTGHSTRKITASEDIQQDDVWYLIYTDDENVTRTVKGTLPGIRRSLKEGMLGDASNIRASRTKSGPFESLRSRPEFRDLVLKIQVTPSSGGMLIGLKAAPSPGAPGAARVTPVVPVTAPTPPPLPVAAVKVAEPTVAPITNPMAPLIDLEASDSDNEWVKWLLALLCTAGIAAACYFLLLMLISHFI